MTTATLQKRNDLTMFIEQVLSLEPSVMGVICIGSVANNQARADSDIDAIIFIDPFDWYIVPAEFKWVPTDGTFHSIFSEEPTLKESIRFDFTRLHLKKWTTPSHEWPEGRRAELHHGWVAFDRNDKISKLIHQRTTYPTDLRKARLDEAITWLDQHLSANGPQHRWDSLGPLIAHNRLQAAYHYLVQALFAYNHRWRPWRNREMTSLLTLPWIPEGFVEQQLVFLNPPLDGNDGYRLRVQVLQGFFQSLLERLKSDGEYGADVIREAFISTHNEPGRAWNMDEW